MLHKLQYISQGSDPAAHIHNIESVLDAGVKLIQLRLKNSSDEMYTEYGIKAKELCGKYHAQLIINDNPMVAKTCHADALHLGLSDMGVLEARQIIAGKIIGGTANTIEHIKQRYAEKVNYIGLGPYRFTSTKEKLSPVLGIEGYRKMIHHMKTENIDIPVYAIGGIELKDIEAIIATGIYGIAVSGLLTQSSNKENLVKEIHKILDHA
ncbi:MAG: thiamine phosphate synthase [Bacteroidota bacterium]